MICPPSMAPTVQPWWGHTASKALKAPAVGWVTTVCVSGKILPPPTGISEVGVPAPPPADGESPPAVGTGGLLQAASAPAPTTTPATLSTPRRSGPRASVLVLM